jgi:hypothetical protein
MGLSPARHFLLHRVAASVVVMMAELERNRNIHQAVAVAVAVAVAFLHPGSTLRH